VEKISEHVYVYRDSRHTNLGLIIMPHGPVLVDSPMLPDDAREWREAVVAITTERPLYLINTDHHLGHSLGNWAFPETPTITHRYTAYWMLEKYDATFRSRLVESFRGAQPAVAAELETLALPRPRMGVVDELTLHIGEFAVELHHVGGHTPGTLLVRVPQDEVLFTGDVVIEGGLPYLGDANSRQWLDALKKISSFNARFIMPGHGTQATQATLDYIGQYVQTICATVEEYYNAGLSRKDVVSKVKALDGFTIEGEDRGRAEQRLKASLQRVYDEFKERDKELEKARAD
jgi:cyclase